MKTQESVPLSSRLNFNLARAAVFTLAGGLVAAVSMHQARASPSALSGARTLTARAGVDYGFDADCGLDRRGETHIWQPASFRQAAAPGSRDSRCVIDGDQRSARFRCFCSDQKQSSIGDIEASKIPVLAGFSKTQTTLGKEAIQRLCQDTFQAQCGPLAKALVADCGTPTRDFCEVRIRGDVKDERYNLFDESCRCQENRAWKSSQRLVAAVGSPGTTAQERCQTQLERCRADKDPSFDPIQMLNEKGYDTQRLSCSRFGKRRVDRCELEVEGESSIRYYCNCDGAERGGHLRKRVSYGAKTLYAACQDELLQCDEIQDTGGVEDDCDTSSSSDTDCESSETSSVEDASGETGADDDSGDSAAGNGDELDSSGEDTASGEPELHPAPGDVLESIGCRTAKDDGPLRSMLSWAFVLMLVGRRLKRRARKA